MPTHRETPHSELDADYLEASDFVRRQDLESEARAYSPVECSHAFGMISLVLVLLGTLGVVLNSAYDGSMRIRSFLREGGLKVGPRLSTTLFARKHLAVRYGDALDNLKRANKFQDKLEETAERMNIDLDQEQDEAVSGIDKRRLRNRDLKETFADQPEGLDYLTRKEKERNWTPEEIIAAVTCLNLSYGIDPENPEIDDGLDELYERLDEEDSEEGSGMIKESEDDNDYLTDLNAWSETFEADQENEDRLSSDINWEEFAVHANEEVIHFGRTYGECPQVRNRVQGWLEFHIKKRDIRFEEGAWLWDPAGADKRGRDKKRARHRSGDKNRPPGSKARRRRRFTRAKSRIYNNR